jgi:hypothetical protein
MTIPLNRVLSFAGPQISIVAGAVSTWLFAKLNVLGVPGLDQSALATQVASGLAFAVAAGLTWLGQSAWLRGNHIILAGDAQVQAAGLVVPHPPLATPPPDLAHEALMAQGEDLPSDDDELAAPPPRGA